MMLVISADVVETLERFGDMENNIRDFAHIDIHDELLDWQVEDMHRQYPNISSDQEYVSWYTQIWPRSRTYDQTHKVQGRVVRRRASAAAQRAPSLATTPRLVRGAASRPILREALFNRLVERMTDLLGERLTWSRTGPNAAGGSRSGLGGGAEASIAARAKMLEPSNYRE
jgi:hypothetical protein